MENEEGYVGSVLWWLNYLQVMYEKQKSRSCLKEIVLSKDGRFANGFCDWIAA